MGVTREQFSTLVKGLKSIYTRPGFIPDQFAFDTWYSMLCDLEYADLQRAMTQHIKTNPQEPSVAHIRNLVRIDDDINPAVAWGMVVKAIRNSAYHAAEEFAKLPPEVQEAVGSADQLKILATSEDDDGTMMSVAKSNFDKAYRTSCAKNRAYGAVHREMLSMTGSSTAGPAALPFTPGNLEKTDDMVGGMPDSVREKFKDMLDKLREE